ncbi:hypothetical protein GH714_018036 [Hevea brasiliensis]|uniref:Uncharacterized protein n=1 Tax=Hevea brasiliensis TaxID=3981 RepID=A0A6A6N0G8_HEVBR|nr:hypothetical protein GH714_018036 [Hevea brasiliensis]
MGISASNPSSLDPTTGTTTIATGPTTASLSLTIHMLFTAVNPNKEAHSERQVEATISVDRYSLIQANAADLIKDASLNDRVELRVLGEVGAKIRVLDFDSPGVQAGTKFPPSQMNCKSHERTGLWERRAQHGPTQYFEQLLL